MIWVEEQKVKNEALVYLPYKFTGKERDEETGLYYFGARYLDAKYSRWLSTDPALGDYVSKASKGQGGIFNALNLNLYHYANNNPLIYTDPSGESVMDWVHTGLDIVGFIPGVGDIADGVNAVIYLCEGDSVNAALSATSMIPVVGDAVSKGGKAVKTAIKHTDDIVAAGKQIAKHGDDIIGAGKQALKHVDDGLSKATKTLGNSSQTKTAEGFAEWLNKGEANNKVYFGIKDGKAQYTGISKHLLRLGYISIMLTPNLRDFQIWNLKLLV